MLATNKSPISEQLLIEDSFRWKDKHVISFGIIANVKLWHVHLKLYNTRVVDDFSNTSGRNNVSFIVYKYLIRSSTNFFLNRNLRGNYWLWWFFSFAGTCRYIIAVAICFTTLYLEWEKERDNEYSFRFVAFFV